MDERVKQRMLLLLGFWWLHMVFFLNASDVFSENMTEADKSYNAPMALQSFLLRNLTLDLCSHSASINESQWKKKIQELVERLKTDEIKKMSCKRRCGWNQRHSSDNRCYCDKFCKSFNDCCFDFDELCTIPQVYKETCVWTGNDPLSYFGRAAWSSCPKNFTDENTKKKCQNNHEDGNGLNFVPVFDKYSNVTYKNIFCARCNGAMHQAYWQVSFYCQENLDVSNFNLSKDLKILQDRCHLYREPVDNSSKRCIQWLQPPIVSNSTKGNTLCQAECLGYALLVASVDRGVFRNPQCALCNGIAITDLLPKDLVPTAGLIPSSPATIILFKFTTPKCHIEVEHKGRRRTVYQTITCPNDESPEPQPINRPSDPITCLHGEVFDPHYDICKKSPVNGNGNKACKLNCPFETYKKTDYELAPNGFVFLKIDGKLYDNLSYIICGDKLLLCVNLKNNDTATRASSVELKENHDFIQLFSFVGSVVSIVSLVLLILTYAYFVELRNLPGKIILNLAISLLLYQSVLLSAGKKDDQVICQVIAVLLHLFALSSFTWMSVMAYDVNRTFTKLSGPAISQQEEFKKRLICYSLYAWGGPVFVVLTCVTVGQFQEHAIGYGLGKEECFIFENRAKIFSFILPVGLILIFNLFALGHASYHIAKTRKRAKEVTKQQQSSNVALICVKMALVMGVTWILGIPANLEVLSFLWYPYVVLTSLQGLFIFLSFAATGRALKLYRCKLSKILGKQASKSHEDRVGDYNVREKFICREAEKQKTNTTQV